METVAVWVLGLGLLLLLTNTEAAVRISARERLNQFHGNIPRHFRYKRSSGSLEDIFGLVDGEDLEIQEETTTVQGTKLYKMTEKYRGKPVFDTVVTMSTIGQTPVDAHGHIVQEIHKDVDFSEQSLTKDKLFDILIHHFKDEVYLQDIGRRKLRYDVYVDSNDVAHNVVFLEYLIQKRSVNKRPTGIIKTKSGEIIHAWDNLNTCRTKTRRVYGGNYKIGKVKYGVAPKCLMMRRRRGTCYLRNKHVKIVDMFNSENHNITKTARFRCRGRYRDRINGAYSPALDALYHGTVLGKMFKEWFGTKPLKQGKMVLRVHYSHHFTNAFWNGENCTFGDGVPGVSFPFTSLDIIGHEVAHGITEEHSRLMYINEPGAINEAFSDITGEMAELYADTVDWRVGYAIQVEGSMRYFGDPERDNKSISHVSQYRDGLKIHDTSGIFNYVFYLLAYEYGHNPKDVYSVFLHANKMYWHPMTNFRTGACDVMYSAYDLGLPGEPFARAFSEVGITACDIADHVIHLRDNVTLVNITVSDVKWPVFAFELPAWSDKMYVESSSKEDDIYIRMYYEQWDAITGATPPVLEGYNWIRYTLPRYHSVIKFFVQLSTDSPKPLKKVKLRGGYTCKDYFHTYDYDLRAYFYYECLGIDIANPPT